jgi:16S rRNA (cytosine1402-N4)-methyltransferase
MGLYHNPILLSQAIDGLNIQDGGIYLDLTYGGGGYSNEILKREKNINVFAFDMDSDALENHNDDKRLTLFHSNFCFFDHFLQFLNVEKIQGIVADLGVSSHQFDTAERGFSFRFDGPLDLRMNQHSKKTAADVINTYDENEISNILYQYGDVENSKKIAQVIVKNRTKNKITTTNKLVEILSPFTPKHKEHKFLAKVFQALRIEVNDEVSALKEMLQKSVLYLAEKGRISIVSYHSVEDTLVKNFFRSGNFEGNIQKDYKGNPIHVPLKQMQKKAIAPDFSEIEQNNRARSAKLRIAERV